MADIFNMTDTWNAGGTTFTAVKMNVTDTASASGSLLMDLQVGGSSKLNVTKDGTLLVANGVSANTSTGFGDLSFGGSGGANAEAVLKDGGGFQVRSGGWLGFSSNSGAAASTADVFLRRDAANTLALRNGANAQTFRAYNAFTDASNGEWGSLDWTTNANTLTLATKSNGTGSARGIWISSGLALDLFVGANSNLNFNQGGSTIWKFAATTGHLLAATDNTYDIGASGANRPRNVYVAGSLTTGTAATFHTTSVALTNGAGASTGTLTNAPAVGNPTKWIGINDNGTTRYIPAW